MQFFFAIRPLELLQRLFAVEAEIKPLDPELSHLIRQEFANDEQRLQEKFGLPVDRLWLKED